MVPFLSHELDSDGGGQAKGGEKANENPKD